jgi:hypothetical protein
VWGPSADSALGQDRFKSIVGRVINDTSRVANAHFMKDTVRNLLFDGHKSDFLDRVAVIIHLAITKNISMPMNIMPQADGTFKFAFYPVSPCY